MSKLGLDKWKKEFINTKRFYDTGEDLTESEKKEVREMDEMNREIEREYTKFREKVTGETEYFVLGRVSRYPIERENDLYFVKFTVEVSEDLFDHRNLYVGDRILRFGIIVDGESLEMTITATNWFSKFEGHEEGALQYFGVMRFDNEDRIKQGFAFIRNITLARSVNEVSSLLLKNLDKIVKEDS